MREAERALRPGGLCIPTAVAAYPSGRIASAAVFAWATTERPAESRSPAVMRAGLSPVWSWLQACGTACNVTSRGPVALGSWHAETVATGGSQSIAHAIPITGVAATSKASSSAKDRSLTTLPVYIAFPIAETELHATASRAFIVLSSRRVVIFAHRVRHFGRRDSCRCLRVSNTHVAFERSSQPLGGPCSTAFSGAHAAFPRRSPSRNAARLPLLHKL